MQPLRSRQLEVEGFRSAQGFVVFQVDDGPDLGTIVFSGPRDWNPTWSGVVSPETRTAVMQGFHRLSIETRMRLFGL